MKNNKKVTRLQLDDTHPDELIIIGLVSSDPDYKLSLLINNNIGISLKNIHPVKFTEGAPEILFSRFYSTPGETGLSFSLVSNRCEREFLFRKLKNIDYIFVSHDPEKEIDPDRLASDLRGIESVTAAFRLDRGIISDKIVQYLIH